MGSSFAGEKLKKLRQDMGWNQTDLADRIGVTGSLVSMYENGQREPARQTLMKIAKEFNVSMDDFYLDSNEVQSPSNHQNPLKDPNVDFGFSISRSKRNGAGGSIMLTFERNKPILKVNGDDKDFAALYSRLQPEDKIAVCKAMLERAKDELLRGV